jgi:hypothetical protein
MTAIVSVVSTTTLYDTASQVTVNDFFPFGNAMRKIRTECMKCKFQHVKIANKGFQTIWLLTVN